MVIVSQSNIIWVRVFAEGFEMDVFIVNRVV